MALSPRGAMLDKYAIPPVEPGHAISTCVIPSERAVPEQGERKDRNAEVTPPTQPISIEGTVGARESDMPTCINESPNMAADLHSISVSSAAMPTTNSMDCLDLGQQSPTSDGFSLPENTNILQKPTHVECNEISKSSSNHPSSPGSFTADNSNTFTLPLFNNKNPDLVDRQTRIIDLLVLPVQHSTMPSRETAFCTEDIKVEQISRTCLSAAPDTLLGPQIVCSSPSDSVSSIVPSSLLSYCGVEVHKSDKEHIVGSSPTFLKDNGTFVISAGSLGRSQETKTADFESSMSLLSTLEMKATSELSLTPVKAQSLEMVRRHSQVEYTDTSSDDDRLVIEM